VGACGVVVQLELGKLPFQIMAIPEQHLVEEFAPHRPDHALDERVRQRHVRYGLDLVDLENPKVRPPTVSLEQWIVSGAQMSGVP
jgi:hypothetical protein